MWSLVAGVLLAALSLSQVPSRPPSERFGPREGTSSGTRPVSPAVVASWIARVSPREAPSLEIAVLWRGTPGWFTSGQGGMSSGGGGIAGGLEAIALRAMYGGISLELELTREGTNRTLRLQGRDVRLDGANIVLVDGVDGLQGPAVVRTLYVDPAMTEAHFLPEVLKRSAEIFSFLRCDVQLPDSFTQRVMDLLCAQATP